jgi:hypothetical protein
MKLVWQSQNGLGQHFPFLCIHSQLSLVGSPNSALYTDNITIIGPVFEVL